MTSTNEYRGEAPGIRPSTQELLDLIKAVPENQLDNVPSKIGFRFMLGFSGLIVGLSKLSAREKDAVLHVFLDRLQDLLTEFHFVLREMVPDEDEQA